MKFANCYVGQRVELKEEYMLGFPAGAIGSIKELDSSEVGTRREESVLVRFDKPTERGLEGGYCLWTSHNNLRKIKE